MKIQQRLLTAAFLGLVLTISLLVSMITLPQTNTHSAQASNLDQLTNEVFLPITTHQPYTALTANCRYGANNSTGASSNQWFTAIGTGWWIDFSWEPRGIEVPDTIQHIPQIRMRQDIVNGVYLPSYVITPTLTMDANGLGPAILANPRHLWVAGNEPDVPNSIQDNMYPEIYAEAYHEIYSFIKGIDPTAHVAIAGLSMATPGRMQYLDKMWAAYQQKYGEPMPVDVWNMHLYILSEIRPWDNGPSDGKIAIGTNPALAIKAPNGPAQTECPKDDVYCRAEHDSLSIFQQQITNMRQWMKDHGQQNKPLLLSEFSQLYPFVDYDDPINPTECFLMDEFGQCFTPNRVSSFMQKTMNYLATTTNPNLGYPADGNRLVQQWMWYNMVIPPEWSGGSSSLLVQNYQDFEFGNPAALTQMGRTYRNIVAAQPTSVNLIAGEAPNVQGNVAAGGSTGTVDITAGFYNNGTKGVTSAFSVTFYADAALTQAIATAVHNPAVHGTINGCAWGRNTDHATVTWNDLPVGSHPFWAKIDSNNNINNESNESDNVTSGLVTISP